MDIVSIGQPHIVQVHDGVDAMPCPMAARCPLPCVSAGCSGLDSAVQGSLALIEWGIASPSLPIGQRDGVKGKEGAGVAEAPP